MDYTQVYNFLYPQSRVNIIIYVVADKISYGKKQIDTHMFNMDM